VAVFLTLCYHNHIHFTTVVIVGSSSGSRSRSGSGSVTTRPGHFRPGPVRGTQLPGPQRRTVPTVVGWKAGAGVIFRDGRFDGARGAIGGT